MAKVPILLSARMFKLGHRVSRKGLKFRELRRPQCVKPRLCEILLVLCVAFAF